MKNTLILILTSSLMLACSGDSEGHMSIDDHMSPNEHMATDDLDVDVISAEDADADAADSMGTTEEANSALDELAKELDG